MKKAFLVFILNLIVPTILQAQANGILDVYVFEGGAPKLGVSMKIDFNSGKTDSKGNWIVHLPEGNHQLNLKFIDGTFSKTSFNIVAGKTSEIIVNKTGKDVSYSKDIPAKKAIVKSSALVSKDSGTLEGVVVSFENNHAVEGAEVFVRGSEQYATTNADGSFSLQLSVGKHVISIIHNRYSNLTSNNIQITKDQKNKQVFRLTPSAIALQEFVVTAPHIKGSTASLLDERKEASSINDVLGAEQMAKSGDSNAASALRRVTGLTLVEGKYIYVRGLGERYSSSLLNGSQLPSPEPTRRVVPLDIFPAGVLESVVVQKSFFHITYTSTESDYKFAFFFLNR